MLLVMRRVIALPATVNQSAALSSAGNAHTAITSEKYHAGEILRGYLRKNSLQEKAVETTNRQGKNEQKTPTLPQV
jgi:DNA-binding transcriptional regulator YdaS (Cro superfamily)